MADAENQKINWDEWGKVQSSWERGDGQKEGPFVAVSKKGAVQAAVEASEMLSRIVEARGLAPHTWVLDFRGNPKRGQVACIPIATAGAPRSAASVRWSKRQGSPRASWHIGGVFKDYPDLAPKSDVKCAVVEATGPDGLPVLIIPVKVGLGTGTGGKEGGTPGSQAAASENPKG